MEVDNLIKKKKKMRKRCVLRPRFYKRMTYTRIRFLKIYSGSFLKSQDVNEVFRIKISGSILSQLLSWC